ncbi:hypothetical protein RS130_14220 [Paraglaciecola aquimarina]|uniref:HBM domain-containing protein n=1 Tax=Paraglaciecola aquimarina TaxID=1235557 RepID=A0ABU3SY25_9ALTE|nr:hypothetical protein [Paraglaciecola aquimarina]MDU0354911.1 hypothetical protein [Paraglaciecola aquimarina]
MKKNQGSIKSRLIIIISVCIVGMSILAANQLYNTQRLIKLNNQNRLLLSLNNELLQLRRHEKDFLLRHNNQYLEKFVLRAEQFNQGTTQLQAFFTYSADTSQEFAQVQTYFDSYTRLFKDLTILMQDIGLDENQGYQGEFRQATHELEQQLDPSKQSYLQILLLQLRRHEKDFLLRHDMQYVAKEIRTYQTLRDELSKPSNNQHKELLLLDNYQQKFMQLVETQKMIGLDHNAGLRGQFRQQAHQVENKLTLLNKNIEQSIATEESKIERISFLIMSITLVTLIILLVKSFISLQKAFATFVMFFYRCKREYQHIDERKQGFAEFKYLAMIANEMIDARQEMERELKKAQQEISQLKSRHS